MSDIPIRALILDLGGVLLMLGPIPEHAPWVLRFGATSQERYDALWSEANPYARPVLTGKMTAEEYWVRTGARYGFSDAESRELARTFFHGERLNEPMALLARQVHESGMKVGLLSNAINPLDTVLARCGLSDLFDVVVNSYEVGMMKPDRQIYLVACRRLGVTPAQSLFIDDQQLNVDAALGAGMRALRYTGPETVRQAMQLLDAKGAPSDV